MAEPPVAAAPAEARRCPECGWSTSLPPARVRDLRVSRRQLFAAYAPAIVVALAAFTLGAWLCTARTPFVLGGFTGDRMVYPGVFLADLERVAAGEPLTPGGPPDELLLRLFAAIERPGDILFEPGDHGLSVGFVRPVGFWSERRTFGWPLTIFDRARAVCYADAPRKQGFEPAVTDEGLPPITDWSGPADPRHMPRTWRWRFAGGTLTLRPPSEDTGGKPTMTRISLGALAPLAAALILAWFAPRWCLGLVRRVRGRRLAPARIRLVQALSAVAVLVLLVVANAMSVRDTETPPFPVGYNLVQAMPASGPIYWTRTGFGRLTLRRSALDALRATPGADAVLARDILAVAPRPADPSEACLSVALETESMLHHHDGQKLNAYLPALILRRDEYWRRLDFGVPEPIATPRQTSLRFVRQWLVLTHSSGDPARPAIRAMLSVESLALVVLMLWGLAMAVATVRRVWEARGARRRIAQGHCPCCGYAMASGADSPRSGP